MSYENNRIYDNIRKRQAARQLAEAEANSPPNVNTKEYKKEQLIQALIKELGTGKDRPKRIRKVVNKYY